MRNLEKKTPSRFTNAANPNGVMQTMHRKSDESGFLTYTELLLKRGLLTEQHGVTDGWHLWQRVKEDPEVRKRSMAMAKRNRPHESPSVHAAHSYGMRVLSGMTAKEVAELKERIGA
jgi:hypothetical protein